MVSSLTQYRLPDGRRGAGALAGYRVRTVIGVTGVLSLTQAALAAGHDLAAAAAAAGFGATVDLEAAVAARSL